MDESGFGEYILHNFEGVETDEQYGYRFFYYGSDHSLPFVTIALPGNTYEHISRLDRPGVFRLNIGVSRQTFQTLFGSGKPDLAACDFTALDVIMPHPDYAAQNYICVLSPGEATEPRLLPLLAEAYALAVKRAARRKRAA